MASGNAFTSIEKQGFSAGVGLRRVLGLPAAAGAHVPGAGPAGLIVAFALSSPSTCWRCSAQAQRAARPELGPLRADELWLYLGPLQVQPSELAKLALAVWVADVLVRKGERVGRVARPVAAAVPGGRAAVRAGRLQRPGHHALPGGAVRRPAVGGRRTAAGLRRACSASAWLGVVVLIYLPGNGYRHDPHRRPSPTRTSTSWATAYQVRAGPVRDRRRRLVRGRAWARAG